MKNFKFIVSSILTAFVLLLSSNIYGTSITSMEIVPVKNEKVFQINVQTTGSGDISMRIKDGKGKVKFAAEHKSLTSFEKKIDISDFENGEYTFELEDELFINVTVLKLNPSGLEFSEKEVTRYYKPVFVWHSESRNFDINWLLNDIGTVRIFITDEYGNVVHKSRLKDQFTVHKRYSLSGLKDGTYTINVNAEDRSYSQKIEIE